MTQKSIVTEVTPNGEVELQHGLCYRYNIVFENGQGGSYLSKFPPEDQTYFVVGKEAEYDRKENGQYVNIYRPKKNEYSSSPKANYTKPDSDRQKLIVKQSSLKAAVDLCCAQGIYTSEDVLSRAEAFADWVLNDNNKPSLESDTKLPF